MCVCCLKVLLIVLCVSAASSHVGLDDFVEMTKKYARGVAPSPVMAAAGDDDDEDDDNVVVKNPDELPLQQKVSSFLARPPELLLVESHLLEPLLVEPLLVEPHLVESLLVESLPGD